eukprot:scaffold38838_cov69-Phaeocystis_antarctica.AAC.2
MPCIAPLGPLPRERAAHTVHSTQYTVHSTQYTVHSTQYTVHGATEGTGRGCVHTHGGRSRARGKLGGIRLQRGP